MMGIGGGACLNMVKSDSASRAIRQELKFAILKVNKEWILRRNIAQTRLWAIGHRLPVMSSKPPEA